MNENDENDEEQEAEVIATFQPQPAGESLQALDLIGHTLMMAGNMLHAIGQGLQAVGMDFFRAGKKRRWDQVDQEARREIAASLNSIVNGDS